jgi:hypothetical protein
MEPEQGEDGAFSCGQSRCSTAVQRTQQRRVGVVCSFVSTANADRVEAQCPTTAILPGGQITTQGTIVNRSLNFTLPITGGSGRYQGAGGQVVSRDVSTPTQPQVELTFHLEF